MTVIQEFFNCTSENNAYCIDANYYKGLLAHQDRTGVVRQIGNCMPHKNCDNPNQGRIYDVSGIAPTLSKMQGGGRQPMIITPEIRAVLTPGRINKRQNGRRFKDSGEPMFTLTKQDVHGVMIYDKNQSAYPFRIRRLTPREAMRLQGVVDKVTDKLIDAGISDTQMYRAAGDAMTVNVVYEIAKAIGRA